MAMSYYYFILAEEKYDYAILFRGVSMPEVTCRRRAAATRLRTALLLAEVIVSNGALRGDSFHIFAVMGSIFIADTYGLRYARQHKS